MRVKMLVMAAIAACLTAGVMVPAQAKQPKKTIDSNTFATSTDYCGNSMHTFTVVGVLQVKEGTGALTGAGVGCQVLMSPRSALKFSHASLTGTGLYVVGGEKSVVKVSRTTIDLANGVFLAPGAGGGALPAGNGATLKVSRSEITSADGYITLAPDCNAYNGVLHVTHTSLTAGGMGRVHMTPSSSQCVGAMPPPGGYTGGNSHVDHVTIDGGGGEVMFATDGVGKYTNNTTTDFSSITMHGKEECIAHDNSPEINGT